MANAPSKSIIPFYLGFFRAALLGLDNLSMASIGIGATSPIGLTYKYLPLAEAISSAPNTSHIACHLWIPTASLFMGFVRLIPHLFINEVAAFQPLYFIIFHVEDPRLNYVASFLYFIILPCSFTLLFSFPSIYGSTLLYKLILKVIWFFGFVSRYFCYIPIYLLSSVNTSVPCLLPWVLFLLPKGLFFINFFIRPFACVSIGVSNFMDNWVKSVEREAQIKYQLVTWLIDNYKPILVFLSISRFLGESSLFYNWFYNIKVDKIPYT